MRIQHPLAVMFLVVFLIFSITACDPETIPDTTDTTGTIPDTDTDTDIPGSGEIFLNGNSIRVTGSGVSVNGTVATITSAGSFTISGELNNGQIVVDTESADPVELVLSGVNIHNTSSSPLYIVNAEDVIISLAAGTQNALSDGSSYVLAANEDEPDATIFSKEDLTIQGSGSLTIDANYNNGIKSKDKLVINAGNITVNSVDDAIIGKDKICVKGGNITVDAAGDGLKSTEDEDPEKGYVAIEGGQLTIVSGADAIQAETYLTVSAGEVNITSGGGSRAYIGGDDSAKGLKANTTITITGGTLTIDSADDAINADLAVVIDGGTLTLSSGDDAIHADATVTINDGDIDIITSSEGIEATTIKINDGNIDIYATDDGLNATNKSAGYSVLIEVNGGTMFVEVGPGDTDAFDSNDDIIINGGVIDVVARSAFDAGDRGGLRQLNGGTVTVNGQIVTALTGGVPGRW